MGEVAGSSGMTQDQVAALIAAATATAPQFMTPETVTVDQALANFTPGPSNRGKYIRVSDYGGYIDRVLRVDYEASSGLYFFTPTQAEYARTVSVTGDTTFYALKHPTTMILSGNIALGVTRNLSFDLLNRRPGEIIEVRNNMSSLLGSLNILGTGLGSFLFNTLGGYARMVVDSSDGTRKLVRIQ